MTAIQQDANPKSGRGTVVMALRDYRYTRREFMSMAIAAPMDEPASVKIENVSVSGKERLTIVMRAGGGFGARFIR
jgi:hypothetical protein